MRRRWKSISRPVIHGRYRKNGRPVHFSPLSRENWRPAHFSFFLPRVVASLGSVLSGFVPYMVCVRSFGPVNYRQFCYYLGPEGYRQIFGGASLAIVCLVCSLTIVCVSRVKKNKYIYIYTYACIIFFMNKKPTLSALIVFLMFWK